MTDKTSMSIRYSIDIDSNYTDRFLLTLNSSKQHQQPPLERRERAWLED